MLSSRLLELIRHFPENGVRFLLENSRNPTDLVALARQDWLSWLDLAKLQPARTRFVQADFRHVEADLIFTAPFRAPRRVPGGDPALAFLLVEHQSEPERLLAVRTRGYEDQIHQWLLRQQERQGLPDGQRYLLPVLVLLLYTGTTAWEGPPSLRQLTLGREYLPAEVNPETTVLVNLPALSAERLQREGGSLGWVLWALQQRRAPTAEFGAVLRRVVEELETLPVADARWEEFLWYLHGLVYHAREEFEREALNQVIFEAVQRRKRRQEVRRIQMTIAEALEEKGRREGEEKGKLEALRATLLLLLRKRFGKVPRKTAVAIEACADVPRLNGWLERVVAVSSLAEMEIPS
jgi:hypothetical protein